MLRRVFAAFCVAFAFSAVPSTASEILVIVDLQMQTMHVRKDGETLYRWDVSTGRSGYSTPPGRYQPTRMHKKYFSRKYDNAPMPFSIFFHEGYAIHGTTDLKNLGRIASHGCVRLHPENAATLFDLVKEVGSENTVIRVESQRAAWAVLSDPDVPEAMPQAEQLETVAVVPASEIDDLTTGSTASPVSVSWLRKGLDS